MITIVWAAQREIVLRVVVAIALVAIGGACFELTDEARAGLAQEAARKQQQIESCIKAGGVPFYKVAGNELRYCQFPPCGAVR